MSDFNEEPYGMIFASLKHPVRRKILRMLSKNPMSFSEMLETLKVSSSFLTYHLENLGELILKIDDGKYKLSSFGEAALATMTKVEDIPATAYLQFTDQTKVVRKTTAIALGIICIVLSASLIGVILNFEHQTSVESDAAFRMNRTLVFFNNKTIHQAAGSSWGFYFSGIGWAGYYSVDVQSSTNKTYIGIDWSWLNPSYDSVDYGTRQINYENITYVGTGGEVNFPVLGGAVGGTTVGNNDTDIGATETVTITFYY